LAKNGNKKPESDTKNKKTNCKKVYSLMQRFNCFSATKKMSITVFEKGRAQ
jgi:hypothetical protein